MAVHVPGSVPQTLQRQMVDNWRTARDFVRLRCGFTGSWTEQLAAGSQATFWARHVQSSDAGGHRQKAAPHGLCTAADHFSELPKDETRVHWIIP